MDNKVHYGTVTEAVNKLRAQGFTTDFNLAENCIICDSQKFDPNDFEIIDVYRYEGNSDPADEAAVYAIQSNTGLKGVLVAGYGPSSDSMSNEMLEKLSRK
jgi:hypothetical protein